MNKRPIQVQVKFRLRPKVILQLRKEARRNERSLNAEIGYRIERSLETKR